MGVFNVTIEAGDAATGRFESAATLVDTGAIYTMLPGDMFRRLGVRTLATATFPPCERRRDGEDVGETRVRVEGRECTTIVIFSDNGATSLLGAVTLEQLGLEVDPVAQRLIDVPGYLM